MNPQVSEELISAYFDGEVTPEERTAVERLLAESDEAQRELNETARLSALLHSFPRESAPVELVDNVLRQTSQLPLPSQPPTKAASVSQRHVWREVRAALISAFTTAAVFLLVIYSMPGHQPGAVAVNQNQNHLKELPFSVAGATATPPSKSAESESITDRSGLGAAPEIAATKKEDQPAVPRATMPTASKSEFGFSPLTKDEPTNLRDAVPAPSKGVAPAESATNLAEAAENDLEINYFNNPQSNESFRKELRRNSVVTFVPMAADPDNDLPVVDIQVKDLDQAVEQFAALWEALKIPRRPLSERLASKKADGAEQKSMRPEDQLAIFLVNADGEVLEKALGNVEDHPDLYAGWAPQLPLSLGNTDTRANSFYAPPNVGLESLNTPKPNFARREADSAVADVKVAAEALANRGNTYQLNGIGGLNQNFAGGGAGQNVRTQAARAMPNNVSEKDGTQNGLEQRAANFPMKRATAEPGYEVLRIQNPELPAPQVAQSRGRMPGAENYAIQNQSRKLDNAIGEKQQADKQVQSADNNGRALRMLFLLHPQGEAPPAAAAPAAAAPAGKQQ